MYTYSTVIIQFKFCTMDSVIFSYLQNGVQIQELVDLIPRINRKLKLSVLLLKLKVYAVYQVISCCASSMSISSVALICYVFRPCTVMYVFFPLEYGACSTCNTVLI